MNEQPRFARFGDYILLHRLATGGMAEIFLALDERPGAESQLVVIKRLRRELSQDLEFVAMMMDEGRLLQRLAHPCIVRRLDFGVVQERYYIALEHIWGESLYELTTLSAEQGVPFPASSALFIASRIAHGLHHAHTLCDAQGTPSPIIHRDVTLANAVVSFDGEVKLVDFGIAKGSDRVTETHTGVIKGTLSYLAPEQVRSRPVGPWTDTYQLGVLLYQLLVGCSPVGGVLEHEVMRQIARGEILPPERVRPELPPYVRQVVMRALALEPVDRFGSVLEFGLALESLIRPVLRQAQERLAELVTTLSGRRKLQQLTLIESLLRGHGPGAAAEGLLGWAREQPERALSVSFDPELDLDSLSGDTVPVPAPVRAEVPAASPRAASQAVADEAPRDTVPGAPWVTQATRGGRALSTVREMETALHELRRELPELRSTSWVFEQPPGSPPAVTLRAASPAGAQDDWQDAFVSSNPGDAETTVPERRERGPEQAEPSLPEAVPAARPPHPPAPAGLGTTMEQLRAVLERHVAVLPPQVAARPVVDASTAPLRGAGAVRARPPSSPSLDDVSLPPPGALDGERTLEERSDAAPTRPMPPLPASTAPRAERGERAPGSRVWVLAAAALVVAVLAAAIFLLAD